MTYRIKGILKLPDGAPAANCEIEFVSRKNFSPLVQGAKTNILTSATGAYDVTLEFGEYAVIVYTGSTYPAQAGTILLSADTVAGQDLPILLQHDGWIPATPEYVQQIENWVASASQSAASAEASADAAADSAEQASLNGSSVVSREALRRSYAEAGLNLVDGSFEEGGTLTSASDVLLHKASGKVYSGPIGAVSAGTNPASGGFVDRSDELLRLQIPRTSLLGATSVESLVSLHPEFNSVIVDSDLTLSSSVTLPTGFIVQNGGGVVTLDDDSARIQITPNSKWYADIMCGGHSPDGLFYVDGKITSPIRWYVGEHETEIKCKVSSSVVTGTCLHLDAVCSASVRALISGLKADITLSKMEYGARLTVDRTPYTGAEDGNAYITSNLIRINSAGTVRLLHEQYSGDGVTRPAKEEIACNVYDLAHQPREGFNNYPMKMVGRLQRAFCSFWDSAKATNTSDQVQVFGNDCVIEGPNLPALNSGYVTISGARCKYAGVTYGIPRDRANSTEYERGAYAKCGSTNIAFGGLISASSQSIAIRGTDSTNGTAVVSKTLTPLSNQLPLVIDVDICANMVNSHPYKCAVSIGGATLTHVTALTSGVVNQIKIVLDGDSVSISSQAGDSVSQISSATFTAPLTLSVVVYSDSTATDCGYIRSHSEKAWLLGV